MHACQAELAVETARRAAGGEIGRLFIGFLGSAKSYPGMKLTLQELTPIQQDAAFEKGEIDIGVTQALTLEQSRTFASRVLYRDSMMAVPRCRFFGKREPRGFTPLVHPNRLCHKRAFNVTSSASKTPSNATFCIAF